jgi:hypothetical protein
MTKIIVKTDGGKVRIRLQGEAQAPVSAVPTGAEPLSVPESATEKNALLLPKRLINLMEIRAESAFRPKEEDVELVYALSGSSSVVPDTLHKLSSNTVVDKASPDHIVTSVNGMIEYILKERGDKPKLVVLLHTHPQSTSKPSKQDERYFDSATITVKSLCPGVEVVFGIHAVSSEQIRERQETTKSSRNTIKWSSITREHEVSFYTSGVQPYEVEIGG